MLKAKLEALEKAPQKRIYLVLRKNGKEMTLEELSEVTGHNMPYISAALQPLIETGLVDERRDPTRTKHFKANSMDFLILASTQKADLPAKLRERAIDDIDAIEHGLPYVYG